MTFSHSESLGGAEVQGGALMTLQSAQNLFYSRSLALSSSREAPLSWNCAG